MRHNRARSPPPARRASSGVRGAERNRFAPGVPTFAEQGYRAGLQGPGVFDGLAAMGLETTSSTLEQLARLLKESDDRWARS